MDYFLSLICRFLIGTSYLEDEKSGIIVFIRQDKKEELVLDFYEEDFQYFLDIEIYRPIE